MITLFFVLKEQGEMVLPCYRVSSAPDIREYFFTEGVFRLWSKLPSGEVTVSGNSQEASGCGTWGYDLGVIMVVLG